MLPPPLYNPIRGCLAVSKQFSSLDIFQEMWFLSRHLFVISDMGYQNHWFAHKYQAACQENSYDHYFLGGEYDTKKASCLFYEGPCI